MPAPLEYTRQPPSRAIVPCADARVFRRWPGSDPRRPHRSSSSSSWPGAASRVGTTERNADRVGLTQRLEEALRLAHVRQRLRVAQMRVRVHQADLAAEERRRLGALEQPLQAAVIGHRTIEQPHAIRAAQVAAAINRRCSRACSGRQQVLEDRVDHCQRAVADAGGRHRADAAGSARPAAVENARSRPAPRRPAADAGSRAARPGPALQRLPPRRAADGAQRRASVVSVWKCSVTVQALHRCSRSAGSAGCSESFQSPWP